MSVCIDDIRKYIHICIHNIYIYIYTYALCNRHAYIYIDIYIYICMYIYISTLTPPPPPKKKKQKNKKKHILGPACLDHHVKTTYRHHCKAAGKTPFEASSS